MSFSCFFFFIKGNIPECYFYSQIVSFSVRFPLILKDNFSENIGVVITKKSAYF